MSIAEILQNFEAFYPYGTEKLWVKMLEPERPGHEKMEALTQQWETQSETGETPPKKMKVNDAAAPEKSSSSSSQNLQAALNMFKLS